ncbi:MAG: hypothetical protein COA78_00610 [Blastopirellula sp.]|nr:MAG: hypothetical protein COA78_00610 [Blastopirellula sp.]
MKNVDLYGRVRHAVLIDGMSSREAARVFGVDPRTVAKMLAFSVPPGYRRSQPVRRPKLDAFTGIIDQALETDKLVPKKQRHTSKRIFERLRDEYQFTGGITIVKDYIFAARQRQRETLLRKIRSGGNGILSDDELDLWARPSVLQKMNQVVSVRYPVVPGASQKEPITPKWASFQEPTKRFRRIRLGLPLPGRL